MHVKADSASEQPVGRLSAAPRVSVVICSFSEERWEHLAGAVASVLAQTEMDRETIVVVDHNPGLLGRVRKTWPEVIAVENPGAPGPSGAKNAGIVAARGEFVAFLDDDAQAPPTWLEDVLAEYADPQVIGVGGGVEPSWSQGRPAWFPPEFDWVVGCSHAGMPKRTEAVRNFIGANMSFRREVFEVVGDFRDYIGPVGTLAIGGGASRARCEETELCIRARRRLPTSTIVYNPGALVIHSVSPARSRLGYFVSRCYHEGVAKAFVGRLTDRASALSAERHYTVHTLPRAVLRGIADAVVRRDVGGLMRAGVVVLGFASTCVGYGCGVALSLHGQRRR